MSDLARIPPLATSGGGGGGGVTSVNEQTGEVELVASDVGAVALPTGATTDTETYPDTHHGPWTPRPVTVLPDDHTYLALAVDGDTHPRVLLGPTGLYFGDGTEVVDPASGLIADSTPGLVPSGDGLVVQGYLFANGGMSDSIGPLVAQGGVAADGNTLIYDAGAEMWVPGAPPDSGAFPLADAADVVIDTTTYDNTITGSGKLTAVVGAPGTGSVPILAWAFDGDAFPRALLLNNPQDALLYVSDGTYDPYSQNHYISFSSGRWSVQPGLDVSALHVGGSAAIQSDVDLDFFAGHGPNTEGTTLFPVTLVSGVGQTLDDMTHDRRLLVPVTFNPSTGAAVCTVDLSPDDVTYTTVITEHMEDPTPDETVHTVSLVVPGGWFVKMTVARATIGAGYHY